AEDMIQGNRAGSKEDQGERHGCECKRELVSGSAGPSQQSVVQVHLPDGDREVNANGEGGTAREEARQYHNAAEKLDEGRNISQPGGDAQARHKLCRVVQPNYFVIAVRGHDGPQGQAQDEKSERLQTIEVAQGILLQS